MQLLDNAQRPNVPWDLITTVTCTERCIIYFDFQYAPFLSFRLPYIFEPNVTTFCQTELFSPDLASKINLIEPNFANCNQAYRTFGKVSVPKHSLPSECFLLYCFSDTLLLFLFNLFFCFVYMHSRWACKLKYSRLNCVCTNVL